MFGIIEIEEILWVLTENGRNVLLEDCQKFGISRTDRFFILGLLYSIVEAIRLGDPLESFIEDGVLKKLDRQPKVQTADVWEIRDTGRQTRLIFVRDKMDSIIVSAVSKLHGSLSQAINRGVNRWTNYLKQKNE